jgi:hypothetical protein
LELLIEVSNFVDKVASCRKADGALAVGKESIGVNEEFLFNLNQDGFGKWLIRIVEPTKPLQELLLLLHYIHNHTF